MMTVCEEASVSMMASGISVPVQVSITLFRIHISTIMPTKATDDPSVSAHDTRVGLPLSPNPSIAAIEVVSHKIKDSPIPFFSLSLFS